jgi:hypothetical protein
MRQMSLLTELRAVQPLMATARKLVHSLRSRPTEGRLCLERVARYKVPPERRHEFAGEHSTALGRLFFEHHGRTVHKWLHYLPLYERHFSPLRGQAIGFLEIGVGEGGSLDLWRKYLGPQATIFGIDVVAQCASCVTPPNQVRIGSQDDRTFLRGVVAEMGALNVVLDDGSHIGRHQRTSFEVLFPLLSYGGLYVIEDIATSYWRGFHQGGYRKRGTAIEQVKQMIDDMHAWYHDRVPETLAKSEVGAIHVYDQIVVIEKARRNEPRHIRIG